MSSDGFCLEKEQWRHLFSSETICILHTLHRPQCWEVEKRLMSSSWLPSPPPMDQGQWKRDGGMCTTTKPVPITPFSSLTGFNELWPCENSYWGLWKPGGNHRDLIQKSKMQLQQDLTHNWVWTCKPWEIEHMQHQLSWHNALPTGRSPGLLGEPRDASSQAFHRNSSLLRPTVGVIPMPCFH